jgi:hypothetical protein
MMDKIYDVYWEGPYEWPQRKKAQGPHRRSAR